MIQTKPQVYYFGAAPNASGDTVARLWSSSEEQVIPSRWVDVGIPRDWHVKLDGGFVPRGNKQSCCSWLKHPSGWHGTAFVDYSVDHRPGANAGFYAKQHLSWEELIAFAKQQYPAVFARLLRPLHMQSFHADAMLP